MYVYIVVDKYDSVLISVYFLSCLGFSVQGNGRVIYTYIHTHLKVQLQSLEETVASNRQGAVDASHRVAINDDRPRSSTVLEAGHFPGVVRFVPLVLCPGRAAVPIVPKHDHVAMLAQDVARCQLLNGRAQLVPTTVAGPRDALPTLPLEPLKKKHHLQYPLGFYMTKNYI